MASSEFPLVSIITPSFQQAAFLEKTIRSVLDQDYPNIEYMVVDGGSTDGSVEIIKKYADRLAWWVSEKDHGQAEAINKGFARARGEYIAWVNSDDGYLPGAVAEAVKALQEHPEAGFVYGNVRVVDAEERVLNELHYADWKISDLMSFHIIGQPAVFMRRSVLLKAGFLDLSYHFLLDHHLWLRMALNGGMVYKPRLWAEAHYHEGCKNLAQAAEFGREALRIVDWMNSSPEFSPYLKTSQQRRTIHAGAERINGFYLLDAGEYRHAFGAYLRAFFKDPRVVLPEWYRPVYALFAPLGLAGLKEKRIQRRMQRLNQDQRTR